MSETTTAERVSVEVRSGLEGLDLVARATAAPAKAEVGVPIRLSIGLTGADADRATVAWPPELGAFSVRPVPPRGEERFAAELRTFDAGAVEIPPVPILVEGKDAVLAGPLSIESITLREGEFDPARFHDIRGEVAEPTGWSPLAVAAAALALVAAVAFLATRRRRPETPLAPHEWALGELDRLAAADLVGRGDVHGFFVALSDIVRGYVERRFGIDAPDRTTREFLEEARRSPALGEERRATLAGFLREADLVKFAGARPDRSRCEDALALAREFVVGSIMATVPAGPEAMR